MDADREVPGFAKLVEHMRRKRIALGQSLRGTTKVYLDTKYWLLLRDARLGRPHSKEVKALLDTLTSLVCSQAVICPFNCDIFMEVLKQSNEQSLRATFALIDELSRNVSFLSHSERVDTELYHFVESMWNPPKHLHPLRELVWSRPAYVFGFVTPDAHELPDDVNAKLQWDFANYIWDKSLTELMSAGAIKHVAAFTPPSHDISNELNEGKVEHTISHRSFKTVFQEEMAGILDYYKPRLASLTHELYRKATGNFVTPGEMQREESARLFANLIYSAFAKNRIKEHLPTFRVGAALHAAVRWDMSRRYHANDFADFRHAEAALPYCDFFLTDRSLCTTLKDRNLRFSEFFRCRAIFDVAEAHDALRAVLGHD